MAKYDEPSMLQSSDMRSEYLRSIWKDHEEELAQKCIEEVYTKRGFTVKNYHEDDRTHENGIDLRCTRSDRETGIAFAVKKKPRKADVEQLRQLTAQDDRLAKRYVYLDFPTKPFEEAMQEHRNVDYVDWQGFHTELIVGESIKYLLLYFSVHPLFVNLRTVYEALYRQRSVKYYHHAMSGEETKFLWCLKDDAVKLRACSEYLEGRWRPQLLSLTEYKAGEYAELIERLHIELDLVNSIAGVSLSNTFQRMEQEYPHLIGQYWDIVSFRTVWKEFTATTNALGKNSGTSVSDYILHSWVMPSLEANRRSNHYYPMKSLYSALIAILENTSSLAEDIEDGIDWLHDNLQMVWPRRTTRT